jgi:DNA invertase Pin-like site-specific DNA recombinase
MNEIAGRWLRVSTKRQDEENQAADIDRWSSSHDYDNGPTYQVHGASAFKGNKKFDKTWAQVISDLRSARMHVLLLWKLDRMDCNLQTFQMLREVVEAGGRVEFVTEPQYNDLTTMAGRIALKVGEEMAYAESRTKSNRAKAKKQSLQTGGYSSGRYPFGFTSRCSQECGQPVCNHPKFLGIDEYEAGYIRKAVALYLGDPANGRPGVGLRAVAEWRSAVCHETVSARL